MKRIDVEKRRKRIRRLSGLRSRRELRLTPGFQTDEALDAVAKKLPTDFEPYGRRDRSGVSPQHPERTVILCDCSCNCRWFHELSGTRGMDWGVCANPKSPRAGLLTFEHMGCPQYEWDTRFDFLETDSGKKMLERHRRAEQEIGEWRQRKGGLLSRVRSKR
jgi:hypothetical protein